MLPNSLLPLVGAAVAQSLPVHAAPGSRYEVDTLRAVHVRPELETSGCLTEYYHGSYGGSSETKEHIYLPGAECLKQALDTDENLVSTGDARVVWVGHAGVDPSVVDHNMATSWESIQSLARAIHQTTHSGQHTFAVDDAQHFRLLRQSDTSLLLLVPPSHLPILDTLLPAHLVPVALPVNPLPMLAGWESVPKHLVQNLANITKHLQFDPVLSKVLNEGIQMDNVRKDVRWLTGEGPSGIESRHSFTSGAVKAAHWIKDKVESSGAVCDLHHYMPGFSPNVICTYPSLHNSSEHVILSAHYDSRGSFGNTRAPGGDDDGSGTGHLLSVVEAIKRGNVEFGKKVQVAFFSGEEQGLYGSHAYAEFLHKTNETVILHVQADMLGYHGPGEPMQLGLPESIGTPEAAYLLGNLSHIYSPELVVGRTSACCSDHQSFHAFGFPATQVFERNGWILDPMYHNSGDVSQREGYDFDQIVSIAKVTMSAVLTVAGYRVGEGL